MREDIRQPKGWNRRGIHKLTIAEPRSLPVSIYPPPPTHTLISWIRYTVPPLHNSYSREWHLPQWLKDRLGASWWPYSITPHHAGLHKVRCVHCARPSPAVCFITTHFSSMSFSNFFLASSIRQSTSSLVRLKFSILKAYTVTSSTPRLRHQSRVWTDRQTDRCMASTLYTW